MNTRHQRGLSLIESLIGLLVLSTGLLATVKLQTTLRLNADVARQRSEAVRWARQDIERLRAFSRLHAMPEETAASGPRTDSDADTYVGTYANITTTRIPLPGATTHYTLLRDVAPSASASLKLTTLRVQWADRSGSPHSASLHTGIAGTLPQYSAALALAPTALPPARGHASPLPWDAHDLGDGRSVWKPVPGGALALVFDHRTGNVISHCSVARHLRSADITTAHLSACAAFKATLLQGHVRFSLSSPPDAGRAHDKPLALALQLTLIPRLDLATEPQCETQALRTLRYTLAGHPHTRSVPLEASAEAVHASLGTAEWQDIGEHFMRYTCWVPETATGHWSGEAHIVPIGWAIGLTASEHKVCRYSADLDHSGAIDRNAEHPARYLAVPGSLAQQNYLVIRGDHPCPSGPPHNEATVQHQPPL